MPRGILTEKRKYSKPGTKGGLLPIKIPLRRAPIAIDPCANAPFNIPGRLLTIRTATRNTAKGIKAVGNELLTTARIPTTALRVIDKMYNIFLIFRFKINYKK